MERPTEATFVVPNPDFNSDGAIDAADYTVWRDNLGNTGAAGLAVGRESYGVVDSGDYLVWRTQFGSTPVSLPAPASSGQTASSTPLAPTSQPQVVAATFAVSDSFTDAQAPSETADAINQAVSLASTQPRTTGLHGSANRRERGML